MFVWRYLMFIYHSVDDKSNVRVLISIKYYKDHKTDTIKERLIDENVYLED